MTDNDIPMAFPSVCLGDPGHPASVPGMTLRDWFAGQAIAAVVAATSAGQHFPGEGWEDERPIHERMADDAFKIADAMLLQREKEGKRA